MLTSDTKALLLGHTRDLFLVGGLEAVNLREVARRTGVTPTAVYRHFSGRDDLLRAMVSEAFGRFDQALAQCGGTTPQERFEALALGYWNFALAHPRDYRILFVETDTVGYKDLPKEAREAEFRSRNRLSKACQALGSPGSELMAAQVWSALHGAATLALAGRLTEAQARAAWEATLGSMIGTERRED